MYISFTNLFLCNVDLLNLISLISKAQSIRKSRDDKTNDHNCWWKCVWKLVLSLLDKLIFNTVAEILNISQLSHIKV